MPTQEIPRASWNSFLDTFSRQHQGWLATLEVIDPNAGAEEEVHELPLQSVTVNSETEESENIEITFGKADEEYFFYVIDNPSHVWLEQTTQRVNAALEIESEKSRAFLRFRSPVSPEFVDGVVLAQ